MVFGRPKGTGSEHEMDEPQAAVPRMPSPMPAARPLTAPSASAGAPQDAVSSISAGMTIIGKFIGEGAVKVFGRIEGELQAATVTIYDGADVEGNVVAQDLTVGGRVKGTIHAVRVKLQGTAVVEGDIFHRSLSIEENARFEGSSRREDTLGDGRGKPAISASQVVSIDGNRKFRTADPAEDLYQPGD
jgi:cytoskeletal protein CcmA (bactofilin family)